MDSRLVRLAPRVAEQAMEILGAGGVISVPNIPSHLVEPRSNGDNSKAPICNDEDKSGCEMPVNSKTFTIPIILGVLLPVVGALLLFYFLHRRHVRKQRLEDLNDRHASLDFGLGDVPPPGQSKKKLGKGNLDVDFREKSSMHASQRSMDMTLESPYLLPPELQNSRESLHSLSRTIHQNEDPYRSVNQYGDGSSIRSASRFAHDNASVYTSSSRGIARMHDLGAVETHGPLSKVSPPPRQNSLPKHSSLSSPMEVTEQDKPFPHPRSPPPVHISRTASPAPLEIQDLPKDLTANTLPTPQPTQPRDSAMSTMVAIRQSNNYLGAFINSHDNAATPPSSPPRVQKSPPPAIITQFPEAPIDPPYPTVEPSDEPSGHFGVMPPSPRDEDHATAIRASRHSIDFMSGAPTDLALNVPEVDPRRMSMGFRPLPPQAVTETDDPEIRANRIRSFYKEYFDDSKVPPPRQYYEDYDQGYLNDAQDYHPGTDNYVMPYAQPMPRRAMTPPPRGPPRFYGPPRGIQGSGAGMHMGGRYTPQLYPQGSRASSTASGQTRGRSGPQKPMSPPADLNSLPTPSKLKDDSFALMGALEFAPPPTYRDRVAGRSESPLGERRPYSPAVPAYAPTVSSFDDLAAMPSPHMLRKSGTFTGLDFAPPKRFKDNDTMSDAGSVRSNRSGVSAMHNQAIRNGAYRVSRIPANVVFSPHDLSSTLKPQWDMRGPAVSVQGPQ